jgi:outer membrane protein OmpA-like peptidoglycan-associated protein
MQGIFLGGNNMIKFCIQFKLGVPLFLGVFSLWLAGCAGPSLNVEKISPTENPSQLIAQLKKDLTQSREEKVDALSPSWFEKAEGSFTRAQTTRDQGRELEDILKEVAQGRAELVQAKEFAEVARMVLPNAIQARDDARAVRATQFGREYMKAEEGFIRLTTSIEKNNLDWAKKQQGAIVQQYRDLELRAIQENALGQIRKMIADAETQGAKKMVPLTFEDAVKKETEAEEFISKNRYDQQKIQEKANLAFFHANRLKQITREAQELKSKTPEEISLWVEGMLVEVSGPLEGSDMRHLRFESQIKNIKNSIAGLQKENSELTKKTEMQQEKLQETSQIKQSEIESLKNQVSALEGRTLTEKEAIARLEADKRFNRLYEEVRQYFKPEEAEIFKQGGDLLIRLKAMKFPIGQSVILPDNFSLLTKVQRAIRTFKEPLVMIEGHTDSTGSQAINETLSKERAEAVRKYLIANETVLGSNVKAVGFGSQKPLVSNETPEGRAVNRRIDVVIRPLSSSS